MKKIIAGAIALVMLFTMVLFGVVLAEAEKISVVTTIFPIYDWARQVVGDREGVDVALLLDSGVDLHSFQPTARDIVSISACDLFVYVGGESDEWVEDALAGAANPDRVVVNLMDALGGDIREEETVEGMEPEEEEEGEGEAGYDEHVWLSLRNAQKLVRAIADALGKADPAGAEAYAANAAAYIESLAALDAEYTAAREAADFDTLLFGDRFPFRYLTEDYGLNYYAAFSGCSAESEASFETIAFLAGKVDELGLTTVLTLEGGDHRIAGTVVENTRTKNAKVLAMDSMQSTTGADAANGVTYLGAMEKNLEVLKQALAK